MLDANVFGAFFDPSNENHENFQPALNWVVTGKGKLVYGGTKYKNEMKTAKKYLKFFASLERAGKMVPICDTDVDAYEAKLTELEPNKDFDDPHLIAIVLASGCNIICTNDKRAMPYLKRTEFYKGRVKKPKIYQSIRNVSLLTDKHIASICTPCNKLSRNQIGTLGTP
ncbi:type II toxin-antitoxin system VapC family toxin [Nitrosomonas sp. Nm58]|uniref:type II toxin-antitoxin system VapC family toxin n=1 Tax=Nitrosomonas sp. Nm58 TaxID=200126 RepID=UPI00115F7C2C|nr:type II toxin-antitoxin system VapC family toxin [Nitrosomonas sp. Nm58]